MLLSDAIRLRARRNPLNRHYSLCVRRCFDSWSRDWQSPPDESAISVVAHPGREEKGAIFPRTTRRGRTHLLCCHVGGRCESPCCCWLLHAPRFLHAYAAQKSRTRRPRGARFLLQAESQAPPPPPCCRGFATARQACLVFSLLGK